MPPPKKNFCLGGGGGGGLESGGGELWANEAAVAVSRMTRSTIHRIASAAPSGSCLRVREELRISGGARRLLRRGCRLATLRSSVNNCWRLRSRAGGPSSPCSSWKESFLLGKAAGWRKPLRIPCRPCFRRPTVSLRHLHPCPSRSFLRER